MKVQFEGLGKEAARVGAAHHAPNIKHLTGVVSPQLVQGHTLGKPAGRPAVCRSGQGEETAACSSPNPSTTLPEVALPNVQQTLFSQLLGGHDAALQMGAVGEEGGGDRDGGRDGKMEWGTRKDASKVHLGVARPARLFLVAARRIVQHDDLPQMCWRRG